MIFLRKKELRENCCEINDSAICLIHNSKTHIALKAFSQVSKLHEQVEKKNPESLDFSNSLGFKYLKRFGKNQI